MYASSSPSTNLSGRHLRKVAFISSALGGSFLDAFAFTVACTCVQVTCTHTHTHHPHTHRHVTFARTDTATEPRTWYTLSFDGDGQRESLWILRVLHFFPPVRVLFSLSFFLHSRDFLPQCKSRISQTAFSGHHLDLLVKTLFRSRRLLCCRTCGIRQRSSTFALSLLFVLFGLFYYVQLLGSRSGCTARSEIFPLAALQCFPLTPPLFKPPQPIFVPPFSTWFLSVFLLRVCVCRWERESESYNNQVGTFTTFTHVIDVYAHPNLYLISTAATPNNSGRVRVRRSPLCIVHYYNIATLHLSWDGDRGSFLYARVEGRGWKKRRLHHLLFFSLPFCESSRSTLFLPDREKENCSRHAKCCLLVYPSRLFAH